MGEKWICSNCGAENELKFCTKCGAPKPEEIIPEVKVEDNSWDCSCGQVGNTGNFCRQCGLPKEQGVVTKMAEEVVEETVEEPIAEAGAVMGAATVVAGAAFEEAIPEVEIPEIEIPEVEIPEVEIPEPEIPEVEIPEAEMPELEIPEAEHPEMELPDAEALGIEMPEVEVPEIEIPDMEVPAMEMPEVEIPEEVIPEEPLKTVLPEMEAAEDGTWNCTCGYTGNRGNFCRNCGLPKEQGMVMPQPAPENGPWDCPCGQKGNEGKFCRNCGTPREQGFAPTAAPLAAAQTVFTEEAPTMKGPEVPEPPVEEPKKKRSLKPLFFIIGGVIVLAAIIVALVLILGNNKYTINQKPQAEVLEIKEDFALFVDEEQDISFLYPEDFEAETDPNGVFVYDGYEEFIYLNIKRINEKVKPKDYFKQYQEEQKLYSGDLVFSKMEEVEIGGKTLYVVKTNIPELYDQDQYIEIYDDCYITYSVIGSELSTENKILNGVIGSLRTSAKAYPIPDAFIHDNNLGNYSVEVLSDYTVEEIEGGLHAKKKKVDLFVRYLHTDFLGALIYGRDDFLDRTERLTSYMAETLGVDSVDFWDEGTTEMINGKEFTVYEVMIGLKDGTYADGKIGVGDSDNTVGCYLIGYYLDENAGSMQKEEAANFLKSMSVHGDPNIEDFTIKDMRDAGLGIIAFRRDLVGTIDTAEDKIVLHDPDNTQTITIQKRVGKDLFDDIADPIAQDLANQHQESYLEEIAPPEDGRYLFNACQITYTTDKGVNHVYRIYCISSDSDEKYCFNYDVEEGKEDWAKEVSDQIFWSWRLY